MADGRRSSGRDARHTARHPLGRLREPRNGGAGRAGYGIIRRPCNSVQRRDYCKESSIVSSGESAAAPRDAAHLLVDTHAHLQWPSLAAEVEDVLARARDAGVARVLTLGTEPESCRAAVE